MADQLEAQARAELVARQGVGARYDAPEAPADALLWARRGTAYLARRINELSDSQLEEPGRAGQSRRETIARISYQARAFSHALEGIRVGMPRSWRETLDLFDGEIQDAETLPPHALRYLFKHSEVHLNVEWRDLPGAGWHAEGVDLFQSPATVVDTVLLRAKTVWSGAIELGNGGRVADVPRDFLRAIEVHSHQRETGEPATVQTGGRDAWLLGLTTR